MKPKTILYYLAILSCMTVATNSVAEEKVEEAAATTEQAAPVEKQEKFYDFQLVCEADVFYIWTPIIEERAEEKAAADTESKEKVEKPKPDPIKVFYTRAGASGHIEAEVRRDVSATLQKVKGNALQHCQSKHQNKASCISNGYKTIRNDYREADYLMRKTLLDGVTKACELTFGVCSGTESGDVTCYENRPPQLKPTESAGQ